MSLAPGPTPMSRVNTAQWLELAFWLALAGIAYGFSFEFSREIEMYKFGAAGWPRLVILMIVLTAFAQLFSVIRGAESHARTGFASAQGSIFDAVREHGTGFAIRLSLTLALPLVFAGLLQYVGYYTTAPLFLAGYLYLTGERRIKWLIAVPFGIYAVLTVLFTRFLYVGLPIGYWHPFYDFSNWLIVLLRS